MPADLDGPSSSYEHRTHQREREKVGERGEDTPSRGGGGEAAEETKSEAVAKRGDCRRQNRHVTRLKHSFFPLWISFRVVGSIAHSGKPARRRASVRSTTEEQQRSHGIEEAHRGGARRCWPLPLQSSHRIPLCELLHGSPLGDTGEAVRVQSWGRGRNPPSAGGRFASQNTHATAPIIHRVRESPTLSGLIRGAEPRERTRRGGAADDAPWERSTAPHSASAVNAEPTGASF